MKLNKIYSTFLIFIITIFSSCKDADITNEHHYKNKLYVTSEPVQDDLLIQPNISEATKEISYRIASPISNDIEIYFDAAPHLTASYNLIYNDNATVLDAKYYDILEKKVVIKAGDTTSDNIVINFQNTNELDNTKRYVLPITITDANNITILESQRTAYFIFKGAALINVVANIKKIYFPIRWKSNVNNLSTITVEALVRSDNWEAGRENALSTIFGIEGSFLVRVGDADRPRDQVQVVAPGGNFPGPNIVSGLPTNEWTHIAIVYDQTTEERIYYKNGEKVYSDELAKSTVSLGNNCYIGKSWDDSRWLPGDISEVRIWGIKRTPEQIANNPYEVDPNSAGLIAYWKFNEGTGVNITDYTGNGNDITASGEITWVNVELP